MNKNSSGEAIKKLADIQRAVGVSICVLVGLLISISPLFTKEDNVGIIISGIALALIGSWLSHLVSRVLFGFGIIVCNTDRIAHDIHRISASYQDQSLKYDYDKYYDELDQRTTNQ